MCVQRFAPLIVAPLPEPRPREEIDSDPAVNQHRSRTLPDESSNALQIIEKIGSRWGPDRRRSGPLLPSKFVHPINAFGRNRTRFLAHADSQPSTPNSSFNTDS